MTTQSGLDLLSPSPPPVFMGDNDELTHVECAGRAEEARARAALAMTAEGKTQFLQIAETWDTLCASMKQNGWSGIPNP